MEQVGVTGKLLKTLAASITIRTSPTHTTIGAMSTSAVRTVCTIATQQRCESLSTTSSGTTITRRHDATIGDTTLSSTYFNQKRTHPTANEQASFEAQNALISQGVFLF